MIRGWCPTVHEPMPSGDGLLVRVKPFGGRLPAPALAALAEAAAVYGNGVIELTSRGNLQVRGVYDPAAFARAMVAAGLADPDPVREARRNVITVPPCDDALVAEVEAVLARTPGLAPKFCAVVQGNTVFIDGVAVELHDLMLLPLPAGEGRGEGASHTHTLGPRTPSVGFAATSPVKNGGGCLLYPPFGQTDAPTIAHLATLAPEIRTTPWRAFLSPVLAPGFATEPGTITACPGAPACGSASVPARQDAARLQAAGFANLHVSGCVKGCAHPRAATTLTGRDGRYDLIRHGRASDTPDRHGLTLAEAMAAL